MKINELDLVLVGQVFLRDLPKDKRYLKKYFKTPIERSLVNYYCYFSVLAKRPNLSTFVRCFRDHFGLYCTLDEGCAVFLKLRDLEEKLKAATLSFDLDTLEKIKSGHYYEQES